MQFTSGMQSSLERLLRIALIEADELRADCEDIQRAMTSARRSLGDEEAACDARARLRCGRLYAALETLADARDQADRRLASVLAEAERLQAMIALNNPAANKRAPAAARAAVESPEAGDAYRCAS